MLYNKVSDDIIAAMKAQDKVRLMALRTIKKYFIEAQTAPGANNELSDDMALKILAKLAKQGTDTAEIYRAQNRSDLAEEELTQVAIIQEYLPKQLSEEELRAELLTIIKDLGATGSKEMGRVIGAATKKLTGKADGKAISTMVKTLLG